MFSRHTLKNGIRIILAPQRDTKAVALEALIKAGSRHESPAENGIAHFLEHLMFKGTKRRPSTLDIARELDSIGADYNAYTAKDHTGFYVKAESAHLPLAADMLADILTGSIFAPEEVERERGTILEEINMYEDNPTARVGELFEADLFGRQSALGRRIIGEPDIIKKIKRDSIISFWQKHYQGANIALSLAGRFNPKQAMRLLTAKFGAIKRGKRNQSPPSAKASGGDRISSYQKDTNQAHVVMGWPGLPHTHPQRFALSLLSIILGGNMSSRLFIKVRERLGLCYFIQSAAAAYEDAGSFVVQAGLDLGKIDKALAAISAEFSDIKQNGVAAEELARAKEFLRGKIILSLEDAQAVAAYFGKQAMFDKEILSPEKLFAKFERVRLADIKRLANILLTRRNLRLTALSPLRDLSKFARFLDI